MNKEFLIIFILTALAGVAECMSVTLNIILIQKKKVFLAILNAYIFIHVWQYIVCITNQYKDNLAIKEAYAISYAVGIYLAWKFYNTMETWFKK